jgi:hypothetical protein
LKRIAMERPIRLLGVRVSALQPAAHEPGGDASGHDALRVEPNNAGTGDVHAPPGETPEPPRQLSLY